MLDPVGTVPFTIDRDTKVATGGSCFAQHIARRLKSSGYRYLVAEQAPADMTAAESEAHNYGTFSARYGNLYTVRQLVQLFDRAFGTFVPVERTWRNPDGLFVDPYRPRIEPKGRATPEEVLAEADRHLALVREMFETLDIFVFTLGLTESWRVKADGAVLPLVPGAGGGVWDPERYEFVNWSAAEVTADLIAFTDRLAAVNPKARIILTVSPVPLVATYDGAHVVRATTYSKAVLRVAAEEAAAARTNVTYFPSYEIITSAGLAYKYFETDLRSVNSTGVDHVMRVFFRHFTPSAASPAPAASHSWQAMRDIAEGQKVICDEEEIESVRRRAST